MTTPELPPSAVGPANAHCVGPQSAEAGVAPSCQGCPNAAICASAPKGPDPDLERIRERMAGIKHKVLVLSGKGGVGKSTLTKELGFALGRAGVRVGLVDVDICGPSLPRLTATRDEEVHASRLGWEPVVVDENVSLISMHFLMADKNDAVVWRGPRKNKMIKDFLMEVIWDDIDVLLFDTPPGTTDEHISVVSLLRDSGGLSGAIIVTTPQEVALADVRREVSFCQKTRVTILGIVENMAGFVCPKCTKRSEIFPPLGPKSAGDKLSEEYGVPLYGKVPLDPRLMQACEDGVPLKDAVPEGSPAVDAIEQVANRLMESLRQIDQAQSQSALEARADAAA